MERILPYLTGIGIIVFLMVAWAFVQSMWKLVFAENVQDEDVLADRRSCGNCGCSGVCAMLKR